MSSRPETPETIGIRRVLESRRCAFLALLDEYQATNPRLFGAVARGTAGPDSDIDILPEQLLKRGISEAAIEESVALRPETLNRDVEQRILDILAAWLDETGIP